MCVGTKRVNQGLIEQEKKFHCKWCYSFPVKSRGNASASVTTARHRVLQTDIIELRSFGFFVV